jgi:hypothetical protein
MAHDPATIGDGRARIIGARVSRRWFVQGAALCGLAAAGLPVLAGCERRPSAAKPSKRLPRIGYLSFPVVGFAIVIAQKWSLSNLRDTGWMPCPG